MASFSTHKIKVTTETLDQIEQILTKDPQGAKSVKDAINAAVNKVWLNTCGGGEATLLLTQDENFEVIAKEEFSDHVSKILGEGPYKVIQTCKSWVGLSDGLYRLEAGDTLPASWFERTAPKVKAESRITAAALLLTVLSILQSVAIVLLLL